MSTNAAQRLKIKSQGYWFESNRGSKAPGQRLVDASRPEPIFAGVARTRGRVAGRAGVDDRDPAAATRTTLPTTSQTD